MSRAEPATEAHEAPLGPRRRVRRSVMVAAAVGGLVLGAGIAATIVTTAGGGGSRVLRTAAIQPGASTTSSTTTAATTAAPTTSTTAVAASTAASSSAVSITAADCSTSEMMAVVNAYAAAQAQGTYAAQGQPTCIGQWASLPTAHLSNGQPDSPAAAILVWSSMVSSPGWKVVHMGEGYPCTELPPAAVQTLGQAADCISLSTTTSTSPTTSATPLSYFVGQWIGHTRQLDISASGVANEVLDDGCCNHVINVTYQLSDPHVGGDSISATATITSLQLYPEWPTMDLPTPSVGDRYQLTYVGDAIQSSLTNVNYCNTTAQASGTCGA